MSGARSCSLRYLIRCLGHWWCFTSRTFLVYNQNIHSADVNVKKKHACGDRLHSKLCVQRSQARTVNCCRSERLQAGLWWLRAFCTNYRKRRNVKHCAHSCWRQKHTSNLLWKKHIRTWKEIQTNSNSRAFWLTIAKWGITVGTAIVLFKTCKLRTNYVCGSINRRDKLQRPFVKTSSASSKGKMFRAVFVPQSMKHSSLYRYQYWYWFRLTVFIVMDLPTTMRSFGTLT